MDLTTNIKSIQEWNIKINKKITDEHIEIFNKLRSWSTKNKYSWYNKMDHVDVRMNIICVI